jgi:malonyl-CoA decarboxylase
VFYSISNCQDGLRGISFGNFLIKQVAEDLARELPSLRTFVTLSPAPGFGDWLRRQLGPNATHALTRDERLVLQLLSDPSWADDSEGEDELRDVVMGLAAEYFLVARDARGRQIDPVARFHLGNGARLERINWRGDVSDKGIAESYGIMVNYLYDLKDIERNHEAFANEGTVITSRQVRALVKIASRSAPVPALEAPRGESVSMRADPGVAVRTDGSATRKK